MEEEIEIRSKFCLWLNPYTPSGHGCLSQRHHLLPSHETHDHPEMGRWGAPSASSHPLPALEPRRARSMYHLLPDHKTGAMPVRVRQGSPSGPGPQCGRTSLGTTAQVHHLPLSHSTNAAASHEALRGTICHPPSPHRGRSPNDSSAGWVLENRILSYPLILQ